MKNYSIIFLCALFMLAACSEDMSDIGASGSDTGQGGSMARFAIQGNHLYTVDRNSLHVFDVSQAEQPREVSQVSIGAQIETIFPRGENLFIGSQLGMYIYDISRPEQPSFVSNYIHIVSCDPVVADSNYAYVTLRSIENVCGRFTNQLDIIDISNLRNPFLQITYPMASPKGLGIDGADLFVCDDGLKVFDATRVDSLVEKYHFRIEANDVIPYEGNLMVIGSNGLYQYRYADDTIVLASQLDFIPR